LLHPGLKSIYTEHAFNGSGLAHWVETRKLSFHRARGPQPASLQTQIPMNKEKCFYYVVFDGSNSFIHVFGIQAVEGARGHLRERQVLKAGASKALSLAADKRSHDPATEQGISKLQEQLTQASKPTQPAKLLQVVRPCSGMLGARWLGFVTIPCL
jgi:hypothetical protein